MKYVSNRARKTRWTLNTIAWISTLVIGTLVLQASGSTLVPDFTLQLLDGKTIATLYEHRGEPVLINFFHSK